MLIAQSQILPFFLHAYHDKQLYFQNPTVFHALWNLLCVPPTERPPFRRHTPQPPTLAPTSSDPHQLSNHTPQPGTARSTAVPSFVSHVESGPRSSAPAAESRPHQQTPLSTAQPSLSQAANDVSESVPTASIAEKKDTASSPPVVDIEHAKNSHIGVAIDDDTTAPLKDGMSKVEENGDGNAKEQLNTRGSVPDSDGVAHLGAEGYVIFCRITCLPPLLTLSSQAQFLRLNGRTSSVSDRPLSWQDENFSQSCHPYLL